MSAKHRETELNRIHQLEQKFRRVTDLLYDTNVSAEQLKEEVSPYLAANVTFKDPWQSGKGKEIYTVGLAGFHTMLRFKFEFHQVSVQLSERGDRGRALVDGVMQLKQFSWLYTYPLRTILAYDFVIPTPAVPDHFLITVHEEMWSLADMIEAVPLVGRLYSTVFRPGFAVGFLAASRLALRLHSGTKQRPLMRAAAVGG